jgi:phosphoglycerate dehydrogenase-like enzyme
MPDRTPIARALISLDADPIDIAHIADRFPDVEMTSVGSADVASAIETADAALIGFLGNRHVIEGAPRLRWLQTAGAGVEGVVGLGLAERGILLTNGSGIMAPNMAEHAIGLMLAFARNLPHLLRAQQDHAWRRGTSMDSVFDIAGQTVVLVGLGDIGLEIARRLKAFDTTVIGVRRSVPDGPLPPNVDRVVSIEQLHEVVGNADHVISSMPHTQDTIGIFDRETFAVFKRGSRFYNLGRGSCVVQTDLIAALESGHLAGAGLDVTTPEPLPADDPLWTAPNVIITAHTSGHTPQFRQRALELFADNLERFQRGDELRNVVDLARGY